MHTRPPACTPAPSGSGRPSAGGRPCPGPRGHLPGARAAQGLSPPREGVDGGALAPGPFYPGLGSAQQVRQAPGMRGPPPASHLGPVTGHDWPLLPPLSRGPGLPRNEEWEVGELTCPSRLLSAGSPCPKAFWLLVLGLGPKPLSSLPLADVNSAALAACSGL
uniref:Uncharacterized protein n=1 Tax=Rousettus aegyptiacus TaxID=9407 RepID=A0A7J8BF80_ROUAE|nr:hypothetical protein HJG63_009823 [Rousettus aegyptiacus]